MAAKFTDERVNQVTVELFSRFQRAIAPADPSELEAISRPLSFFCNKAKKIEATAKMLLAPFRGEVRQKMKIAQLLQLSSVARKTATMVLHYVYGIDGGLIDTHAKRRWNLHQQN